MLVWPYLMHLFLVSDSEQEPTVGAVNQYLEDHLPVPRLQWESVEIHLEQDVGFLSEEVNSLTEFKPVLLNL